MKKSKELKLDKRTVELLNRVCNERYRLNDVYVEDPCLTNLLYLQKMIELEEDIFEIMGVDLPEFIFSKYRKYKKV